MFPYVPSESESDSSTGTTTVGRGLSMAKENTGTNPNVFFEAIRAASASSHLGLVRRLFDDLKLKPCLAVDIIEEYDIQLERRRDTFLSNQCQN